MDLSEGASLRVTFDPQICPLLGSLLTQDSRGYKGLLAPPADLSKGHF